MKRTIKNIGIYFITLIIITFSCSFLNLLGINSTITNAILFLFNLLSFTILGYLEGNVASKKGYLSGIRIGGLLIIILIIINIIISQNIFTIATLIYYLILALSSTFGAMIGISRKKED